MQVLIDPLRNFLVILLRRGFILAHNTAHVLVSGNAAPYGGQLFHLALVDAAERAHRILAGNLRVFQRNLCN